MKQAEKAQNYHQQVLGEAYNAKILSVQSENSGNIKDGQDQQTVLDAEQFAEQPVKPKHVDEQLTVSRNSHGRKKT